jgi:predicted nuclease of predicted toxin-antitoxin system
MRLLCDENVRWSIYNVLSQEGHDVVRVQDELELGFEDRELLQFCRDEERVLLTNDDDFFQFEDHPGILYLACQTASPRALATAVDESSRSQA